MKKVQYVVIAVLLLGLVSINAYAQQQAGDTELGFSGQGYLSHTSVSGQVSVQGDYGYYISTNQYVGASVGPMIGFGGGTSGTLFYMGEYRYLLGSRRDATVWPFVGVGVGAMTRFGENGSTSAVLRPQAGLKYFVSPRNAFEVAYTMPTSLRRGIDGFGQRTYSLFTFGFKHLLGN